MKEQRYRSRLLDAGGVSDTAMVGDCIGQGTAGAALVSQVNLDQGFTSTLVMEKRTWNMEQLRSKLLHIKMIS